jgi:hypothetical protein
MKKSTVYIDIEDDIAGIIDKIGASDEKIVALVLPKRPSVLQSSVNVQLMKKAAEDQGKKLVLITTDDQVKRLAGVSALYVSNSLQSKPAIPAVAKDTEPTVDEISDDGMPLGTDPAQPEVYKDDKVVDPTTPIGELTGETQDEIELDNSDPVDATGVQDGVSEKGKKRLVPSFSKFRLRMVFLVVGIVILGGALYWALFMAPNANVTLATQKSEITSKLTVTASVPQQTVDAAQLLVPAVMKEDKQKLTSTFTATGKKDLGQKATGSVILYNCSKEDKLADTTRTVPSGTGISNGSRTFIIQTNVTVEPSGFVGNTCKQDRPSAEVSVVATEGGDQYNLSPRTYSVAGFPTMTAEDETGMSGGTTNIVTVVSQDDVTAAEQKTLSQAADNVEGKLSAQLSEEGFLPIPDTFTSENGAASSSVPVGGEATGEVTLTIEVTSTMLGVRLSDLEPLMTTEINKQIDPATQKIYDNGLSIATVAVIERPAKDTAKITVTTTASIGPLLDEASIKEEIKGKRAGEAKQILDTKPGITSAEIELSPFWVFNIPRKTDSITIVINE